jgi:hypothetical protein
MLVSAFRSITYTGEACWYPPFLPAFSGLSCHHVSAILVFERLKDTIANYIINMPISVIKRKQLPAASYYRRGIQTPSYC